MPKEVACQHQPLKYNKETHFWTFAMKLSLGVELPDPHKEGD